MNSPEGEGTATGAMWILGRALRCPRVLVVWEKRYRKSKCSIFPAIGRGFSLSHRMGEGRGEGPFGRLTFGGTLTGFAGADDSPETMQITPRMPPSLHCSGPRVPRIPCAVALVLLLVSLL